MPKPLFSLHISPTEIHYDIALRDPDCPLLKLPHCVSEESEFRVPHVQIEVKTLEAGQQRPRSQLKKPMGFGFRVGRFREGKDIIVFAGA